MKNPYLNRVAIRDINQFYGRRKEIARIFSRLGASRPQSVSIVGERRIGKSSLLNYIYSPVVRGEQLDSVNNYIFIFMDLQQKRYETIEAFFTDFLELIVQAVAEPLPLRGQDFDGVRKVFAELHRRGRKLIVLLDEFDVITANQAFNLDFFSFLRSAANNYDLAYITSSARELQVLCHADQIADSPFFNIFTNIYLRPFTSEETLLLIAEPSRAAGVSLESYSKAIIDLAGQFPFFLQIACATYVDHLSDGGGLDAGQIAESFLDEAGVHFRYIWEHFSSPEREVVDAVIHQREIPRMHLHVADALRRNGYLTSEGRLFSRCFATAIAGSVTGRNLVRATPVVKQKRDYYPSDPFIESGPRLAGFDRDSYAIPPTDPALHPQDLGRRWGQVKPEKLQQILQIGQIGRFELLQVIGEGGMGQVILARDCELTRQVAIKLLKERYASDEQIRRRFLREAQTASILSHPNIATIYEIGEINGIPYIVMEYVRGRTLAALARKHPLPVAEIVQIGLQVAQALAEAHQAGIVHRDIKSSNILLSERGQIKVLDFGLAKAWSLAQPVAAAITEPGMLMGTVTYMSPEQAAGKEALDHRTDIFSLGVVMYEISTGKLPFDGRTYLEIIEAVTKHEPLPPHLVVPNIPEKLSQIIMQMLAKHREDRFATADEVAQALQTIAFES
jgi:eukaryotic-like serine/threonine-protein kinase